MRVKIKVTLTTGEEAIFHVAPQIYEIFEWHWKHKRDFKIANRVMKHDEIVDIKLEEFEVCE